MRGTRADNGLAGQAPPVAGMALKPLSLVGWWCLTLWSGLAGSVGIGVAVLWQACRPVTWRRPVKDEFMRNCTQIILQGLPSIIGTALLIGLAMVNQVLYLSIVFLLVSLAAGLIAANTLSLTSLTFLDFLEEVLTALGPSDYALVPLKTLAIGFAIGLISCTTGLALGRAVTEVPALLPQGFVKAILAIFLISGGLTLLL